MKDAIGIIMMSLVFTAPLYASERPLEQHGPSVLQWPSVGPTPPSDRKSSPLSSPDERTPKSVHVSPNNSDERKYYDTSSSYPSEALPLKTGEMSPTNSDASSSLTPINLPPSPPNSLQSPDKLDANELEEEEYDDIGKLGTGYFIYTPLPTDTPRPDAKPAENKPQYVYSFIPNNAQKAQKSIDQEKTSIPHSRKSFDLTALLSPLTEATERKKVQEPLKAFPPSELEEDNAELPTLPEPCPLPEPA